MGCTLLFGQQQACCRLYTVTTALILFCYYGHFAAHCFERQDILVKLFGSQAES